jgi:hypothetical protein
MTTSTLPIPIDHQTPVRDADDLADRVFAWARDVDNHLRAHPSLEVLTVEIDPSSLPLTIEVQTRSVAAVARMQTVNLTNSGLVDDTNLGWRQASAPPAGVEISALDGCSAGTTYAVTLAVIGRRDA